VKNAGRSVRARKERRKRKRDTPGQVYHRVAGVGRLEQRNSLLKAKFILSHDNSY
jgi:hypothetical protein